MALFIILDLTHWAAWENLPLIWNHKCSLPTGVNLVVVCNLTDTIVSVKFNGFKVVVVYLAWTL